MHQRRRLWAQLLRRVYEVDPLTCRQCGGPMRILAFIQEPAAAHSLAALEVTAPPRLRRPAGFDDLTALATLAAAAQGVTHRFEPTADGQVLHVTFANAGPQVAFFIELSVVGERSGHLIAPIYWEGNYVSLLPGERRDLRATIPAHALAGERAVFPLQGVNLREGGAATDVR